MDFYKINQIGSAHVKDYEYWIELYPEYRAGLRGLEDFSHLCLLWWFSGCDDGRSRAMLTQERPYAKGPRILGTFATRAPQRPNPIALSCAGIINLDAKSGIVRLDYLDAEDGSPVLDLKPYTPSLDRVENPAVPAWCAHWPRSLEASGDFDWEKEFFIAEQ